MTLPLEGGSPYGDARFTKPQGYAFDPPYDSSADYSGTDRDTANDFYYRTEPA